MDATVALLTASLPTNPPVKVYPGRVIDTVTPRRFVVVTPLTGSRFSDTYRGKADDRRAGVRLTITAVVPNGSTGEPVGDAEWLAERCESILTKVRPVIDGKRCSAFTNDLTRFMGADEQIGNCAYFVADFSTTIT
jgi:hypothetical protein